MTDFLINEDTNDLVIVNGDWVLVEDKATLCKQAVIMSLEAFRGEWFADINFGTPYIENENNTLALLGKTPKSFFDSQIKEVILSNDEVLGIEEFNSNLNPLTGVLKLEAKILSEDGPVEIDRVVNLNTTQN